MFVMTMAATFRIGDRAQVRINGAPASVTWQDEHTLVINDHDARRILAHETGGIDGAGRAVQTFTCSDARESGGPPVQVTCSWCHALSTDEAWPWCWSCGHRADVPRSQCDCPKCWKPDDVDADKKSERR